MTQPTPEPLVLKGSMKAGSFTAQLFVEMKVAPTSLTLSAPNRSFCLERDHLEGLELTSLLGIFKRGIRFRHRQPDLPVVLVFYPSLPRDQVLQKLEELGWS